MPFNDLLLRSISIIASSMTFPISGDLAFDSMNFHLAFSGTQNTFSERYSSGSSGSIPSSFPATSSLCFASNESDTYFRNIRPSTTCLYSAASILFLSLSAALNNLASKPSSAFFSFAMISLQFNFILQCSSACSIMSFVASSFLSGGYPYFVRRRLMITLIFALA
ncbi:hypothetical protein SDC9_104562 [bioreactor metagenome]|uniref:Uncharacterized protein n=1 Tax=bioreactor metagenome TaxID=1076179 RepID=A0A645AXB9_9ZZZZ